MSSADDGREVDEWIARLSGIGGSRRVDPFMALLRDELARAARSSESAVQATVALRSDLVVRLFGDSVSELSDNPRLAMLARVMTASDESSAVPVEIQEAALLGCSWQALLARFDEDGTLTEVRGVTDSRSEEPELMASSDAMKDPEPDWAARLARMLSDPAATLDAAQSRRLLDDLAGEPDAVSAVMRLRRILTRLDVRSSEGTTTDDSRLESLRDQAKPTSAPPPIAGSVGRIEVTARSQKTLRLRDRLSTLMGDKSWAWASPGLAVVAVTVIALNLLSEAPTPGTVLVFENASPDGRRSDLIEVWTPEPRLRALELAKAFAVSGAVPQVYTQPNLAFVTIDPTGQQLDEIAKAAAGVAPGWKPIAERTYTFRFAPTP